MSDDKEALNTATAMFDSFASDFEKERILREEVWAINRELETFVRKMQAILQETHTHNDIEIAKSLSAVDTILDGRVKELMEQLVSKISPLVYYKHHDSFRFIVQRLVFIIAFAHFVKTGHLIDHRLVAERLSLSVDASEGFHLDLEDYLLGLLQLASELARYSVNSVVAGDNMRPFKIAEFVHNLDSNFRLLNMKNDVLRKRFDVLKYDVQKCENVVYDLKIRGLKPAVNEKEQESETGKDEEDESAAK